MTDPIIDAFKTTIDHGTANDEALLNLSKAIIETVNELSERVKWLETHLDTLQQRVLDIARLIVVNSADEKEIH